LEIDKKMKTIIIRKN